MVLWLYISEMHTEINIGNKVICAWDWLENNQKKDQKSE